MTNSSSSSEDWSEENQFLAVGWARGSISPPASCPIDWQPTALTPVFFGIRDYTTDQGAPVNIRVFFPSLDGAVFSAPILSGCGHYPLILLAHGDCHLSDEHYKAWFTLPAQLARAGYVVAVPELPSITTNPAVENHPALQAIAATQAWMHVGWEHQAVLMPETATGIIGHSFGAMLAARFAATHKLAAYVSLSAGWHDWADGLNTIPINGLTLPMLLMWGGQDQLATLPEQLWNGLTPPRHRVVFANGMHWDYLPVRSTPCNSERGSCTFLAAAATDYVTMFMAKYLPPELVPHLPTRIPDSLTPPPLELTTEQEFYAGNYLFGVAALSQSTECGVTIDWKTVPQLQLAVSDFGYTAGNWRVDRHPRFLSDLTGDGRADLVGFGYEGVWVALNKGDGSFFPPKLVVNQFGYHEGGWGGNRHPRFLADLTGDGRADIVGFGNGGVWTCLTNGDGTFQEPQLAINDFGYNAGNWRVDRHPRFLADLTGDNRADIVGFGNDGMWVSFNKGDGSFQDPRLVINHFGYDAGAWRVDRHPRFLADLTGNGWSDVVGFANDGVYLSINKGNGSFQDPRRVIDAFGYSAGAWRVDRHPRCLADLTGDGRADVVGFADDGVYVAINKGNGSFQAPRKVIDAFGYNAGGWRIDRHPRFLADLTGNGRADIVGFYNDGVYVAINKGNGNFHPPYKAMNHYGYSSGEWRVDHHPRILADLTGDGRADIAGFGNNGVWVSLNKGNGTF